MSRTDALRDRIKQLEDAVNASFGVTGDAKRNCRTCRHHMSVYYSVHAADIGDCFCRLTDRNLGNQVGINGYACGCWEEGEE
jgi:hypothetical protein